MHLQPAANLTTHWRQHWASDPQRVVLADDQGRSFNGDELEHATATAAGRLAGHGAQRGDRVLISCGSSLELAVAHIAALRLGLVVVPANTAYRAEELAHVVSDAGPTLAIVDDPERAGWVAEANPAIIVLTPDVPGQLVRVEDLDTAAAGERIIANRDALAAAFPSRAPGMAAWLGGSLAIAGSGPCGELTSGVPSCQRPTSLAASTSGSRPLAIFCR